MAQLQPAAPTVSAAPAPPAPKMLTARVVTNYGRHLAGSTIEVREDHYLRLRRPDGAGGFLFPVLISRADEEALTAKRKAAEEAARTAARASDPDRATAAGWEDHRRKAADIITANRIKEQRTAHALVMGEQAITDPADARRKLEEGMRAARGA